MIAALCVVFFLLGYVVGSNGELTLGRLGKSKSLRVVGDMYLGDPVVNHPAFTYMYSEQGLSMCTKMNRKCLKKFRSVLRLIAAIVTAS